MTETKQTIAQIMNYIASLIFAVLGGICITGLQDDLNKAIFGCSIMFIFFSLLQVYISEKNSNGKKTFALKLFGNVFAVILGYIFNDLLNIQWEGNTFYMIREIILIMVCVAYCFGSIKLLVPKRDSLENVNS